MKVVANERLRAQRLARGWSQEDVVRGLVGAGIEIGEKQLGVTRNLVSRWEREGTIPRAPYPKLLCLLFQTSAQELGLAPPSRSAVTGARLESLELDRQVEASDLGPATLEQLELIVGRFGLEYLHTPLLVMFDAVRSCRLHVADLLNRRQTLAERARLYGVAGWLSALLSYLAFDVGEGPEVVNGHCETALHLAAETDLDELTAWTRGTQAMVGVYDGHPQEAVVFCETGRQVVPEGSATAVRLWAQEARAYARMGERAHAERAMGATEMAFGNLVQKPTGSIFSFDHPYLPYYAPLTYGWKSRSWRRNLPNRQLPCATAPRPIGR